MLIWQHLFGWSQCKNWEVTVQVNPQKLHAGINNQQTSVNYI